MDSSSYLVACTDPPLLFAPSRLRGGGNSNTGKLRGEKGEPPYLISESQIFAAFDGTALSYLDPSPYLFSWQTLLAAENQAFSARAVFWGGGFA